MGGWFDLTQGLEPGMPKMPFIPEPRFEVLSELKDGKPKLSRLHVCTHLGTHVDAPSHFVADGKNIDQFPLEHFLVEGVVWRVETGPLEAVTLEALQGAPVRPGDALLLSTGWGEIYREPRYFQHPYLADEVARWAVEQGLRFVGVDFLTPDRPPALRGPSFHYPIHNTLLGHEVLIIENLTGLRPLEGKRVELFAAPLLVKAAAEAAPARVFARVIP